jgi:nitrogen fixation protein NifQ
MPALTVSRVRRLQPGKKIVAEVVMTSHPHPSRPALMAELLGRPATSQARNDPLRPILASLLVGRVLNQGRMPATLGLARPEFQQLWDRYFPGPALELQGTQDEASAELTDLIDLLLECRAGQQPSEVWLANIVAWGCAGRDHLWQDLGLANRGELSTLMQMAFPSLATLNVTDMKWKKFIYRHYCSKEGIYVCPAPSCGQCSDFNKCHAPEE